MIIAPNNFRDEELFKPKEILEKGKAEVKIASKGVTIAKGMLGGSIRVDINLEEVKVEEMMQ